MMDRIFVDTTVHKLCLEYSIELHDMEYIQHSDKMKKYMPVEYYTETSSCAGDEIFLGIYEYPEDKLFHFLHELGHVIDELPPYEEWEFHHYNEARAWRVAVNFMTEVLELEISERAFEVAKKGLNTYFVENPENAEKSDISYFETACKIAFGE